MVVIAINDAPEKELTKQKILMRAVDLFASKGYTETSIRDIAAAVGIKPGSLYNHFSSKEELFQYILKDFKDRSRDMFKNLDMLQILQNDPTPSGVLYCLEEILIVLSDEYFFKIDCVIFQEHYRNAIARDFVVNIILEAEQYVVLIIDTLKNLKIIRDDANPDFWKKITICVFNAFIDRTILGLGENSPEYEGLGARGILLYLYDMLFKVYGVQNN